MDNMGKVVIAAIIAITFICLFTMAASVGIERAKLEQMRIECNAPAS